MLDGEQVANRVAVFRASQAPKQRQIARHRVCGGGFVELGLEIRRSGRVTFFIRPWILGRHRLGPQLAHDLFPVLRARPDLVEARGVDGKLRRELDGVVALDTVASEKIARHRAVAVPMHPPHDARHSQRRGRGDIK